MFSYADPIDENKCVGFVPDVNEVSAAWYTLYICPHFVIHDSENQRTAANILDIVSSSAFPPAEKVLSLSINSNVLMRCKNVPLNPFCSLLNVNKVTMVWQHF